MKSSTLTPEDAMPVQLFLVPGPPVEPRSILEALARLYRLYSYGYSGLSTVVRAEIERAALALTAVFLFDLGAWTLIWNAIFHRGELAFDRLTLLAAGFGIISAVIVVSFEQGIMTADSTVPGTKARCKRWITLALRVLVIAASAVATSSVIEVLVFANDIGDRVHEERVWEEVVSRVVQFQRLQSAVAGEGDNKPFVTAVNTTLEGLKEAAGREAVTTRQLASRREVLTAAQGALPRLKTEAQRKQGIARSAEAALQARAKQLGVATRAEQVKHPDLAAVVSDWREASREAAVAASALKGAQRRVDDLIAEVSGLEAELAEHGSLRGLMEKDLEGARTKWDSKRDASARSRDALQQWITRVANSSPDEREFSVGDFFYRERPYSFAEQLRVLADLMEGKPPHRRNLLAVKPEVIADTLGLERPETLDEQRKDERLRSAQSLKKVYYGLLILAFFVPSMGILFKLTMHRQLIDYYSASHQARNGKLDAAHSF